MSLFEHPKITKMPSGWYVVLENGKVFTEHDGVTWKQILSQAKSINYKQGVELVGLKNRNKRVEIVGKNNYTPPGTRHMKEVTVGGVNVSTRSQLVERFIGYYDTAGKVFTRVDIRTGKFRNEIQPY